MRSPRMNWLVLVGGLLTTTNVYAQANPPADPTIPSAAPLPPAPPPPPQSSPPSNSAAPQPPPPPSDSATPLPPPPAMVPPVETVPIAKPPAPPPPIPVSPGPSIWGPAAEHKVPFFKKWYGWQTLAAVLPADALVVAGGLSSNGNFGLFAWGLGIPVHLLTGPINHWIHGHVSRGLIALGANIGVPSLGIFGGAPLMAVGYFLPPIIDAAFVSTMPGKIYVPPTKAALAPSTVAILPMIDGNRKGLTIVGQF